MKQFLGESIGTFILVFVGCGSVAYTFVDQDFTLLQIALCWLLGVFFGILSARIWSYAHLNPAMSFGFWIRGDVDRKYFVKAIIGQFVGAMLAALTLYFIFQGSIEEYEQINGIDRSSESGWASGKMFGEYYNPDIVSLWDAMLFEGLGTAILMFMILVYVSPKNYHHFLSPFFIALTVAILIMFIAPTTQCGINPARDLGPRVVSFIFGWRSAFDLPALGAILSYVIAPLLGALLGVITHNFLKKLT